MATHFRKTIIAAVAVLALTAMGAADAQRWGGGVAVSGGGFRGHPGGSWSGGAWVGGRPGWGPGWRGPAWGPGWGTGWRPGWGPGWGWAGWGPGWGGWGWGLGWNAWGWNPGVWGWSVGAPVVVSAPVVSGAWVLPPSAQPQVWIERQVDEVPAATPATAPGQWWYWCASAQAYYPYVQACAENWQRVAPRAPPGVQ